MTSVPSVEVQAGRAARHLWAHLPVGTATRRRPHKLQAILTATILQMTADDPGYDTALAAQLSTAAGQASTESVMLRQYLRGCARDLGNTLRTDHAIR